MGDALFVLKDIRKIYGTAVKTEVLKGVHLTVDRGEFSAVIGPSGSGKSTLLNIIGTLDSPSSGEYIFDGEEIGGYTRSQLAYFRNRRIGFIFQFHHLLPEFTVLENVLMPYRISRNSITPAIIKRAGEYLALVGLADKMRSKASNLSGGQQQRVAIARALMNNPELVLADEPTGNLDSESSEQVYGLLREINREYQTTFLIVTHDSNIAKKCNRKIEILDGNVV